MGGSVLSYDIGECYLDNYFVVGKGDEGRKHQAFFTWTSDVIEAQYMALAWCIAGFATRVIDLKLSIKGMGYIPTDVEIAPQIVYRYSSLPNVIAVAAGKGVTITQQSLQVSPQRVPYPISEANFFAWLKTQSLLPPTYSPTVATQSLNTPIVTSVATMPPPERGDYIHILSAGNGSTMCGCVLDASDTPHEQSLTEGLNYCPTCQSMRTLAHHDYQRGFARMQMMQEMNNPGQPLHESMYIAPLYKKIDPENPNG